MYKEVIMTDDQNIDLTIMAKEGLEILTKAAVHNNMNDAVALERENLTRIWLANIHLNPVYIGDRISYEPVMILVSLQYEDDGVTPLFIIGPTSEGLAYTNMETLSKMRAEYLLHFRANLTNLEKYDSAVTILTKQLKYTSDQIYPDMPEFTVYRKMGEAGYTWSFSMGFWYQ